MKPLLTALLFAVLASCGESARPSLSDMPTDSRTRTRSPREFATDSGAATPSSLWLMTIPHTERRARCAQVYDGDTLRTEEGEVVRFLGVNAPEIAHPEKGEPDAEPFGDEARDEAMRRLQGEPITLIVPDAVPRDRYGRTLALIEHRGAIVNTDLLRAGLVHMYVLDNREILNFAEWSAIETEARIANRGLWSARPVAQGVTDTGTRQRKDREASRKRYRKNDL